MPPVDETAKVATAAVKGLQREPLALALVIINLLFLGAGIYILSDIAGAVREREARSADLLKEIAERCFPDRRSELSREGDASEVMP